MNGLRFKKLSPKRNVLFVEGKGNDSAQNLKAKIQECSFIQTKKQNRNFLQRSITSEEKDSAFPFKNQQIIRLLSQNCTDIDIFQRANSESIQQKTEEDDQLDKMLEQNLLQNNIGSLVTTVTTATAAATAATTTLNQQPIASIGVGTTPNLPNKTIKTGNTAVINNAMSNFNDFVNEINSVEVERKDTIDREPLNLDQCLVINNGTRLRSQSTRMTRNYKPPNACCVKEKNKTELESLKMNNNSPKIKYKTQSNTDTNIESPKKENEEDDGSPPHTPFFRSSSKRKQEISQLLRDVHSELTGERGKEIEQVLKISKFSVKRNSLYKCAQLTRVSQIHHYRQHVAKPIKPKKCRNRLGEESDRSDEKDSSAHLSSQNKNPSFLEFIKKTRLSKRFSNKKSSIKSEPKIRDPNSKSELGFRQSIQPFQQFSPQRTFYKTNCKNTCNNLAPIRKKSSAAYENGNILIKPFQNDNLFYPQSLVPSTYFPNSKKPISDYGKTGKDNGRKKKRNSICEKSFPLIPRDSSPSPPHKQKQINSDSFFPESGSPSRKNKSNDKIAVIAGQGILDRERIDRQLKNIHFRAKNAAKMKRASNLNLNETQVQNSQFNYETSGSQQISNLISGTATTGTGPTTQNIKTPQLLSATNGVISEESSFFKDTYMEWKKFEKIRDHNIRAQSNPRPSKSKKNKTKNQNQNHTGTMWNLSEHKRKNLSLMEEMLGQHNHSYKASSKPSSQAHTHHTRTRANSNLGRADQGEQHAHNPSLQCSNNILFQRDKSPHTHAQAQAHPYEIQENDTHPHTACGKFKYPHSLNPHSFSLRQQHSNIQNTINPHSYKHFSSHSESIPLPQHNLQYINHLNQNYNQSASGSGNVKGNWKEPGLASESGFLSPNLLSKIHAAKKGGLSDYKINHSPNINTNTEGTLPIHRSRSDKLIKNTKRPPANNNSPHLLIPPSKLPILSKNKINHLKYIINK